MLLNEKKKFGGRIFDIVKSIAYEMDAEELSVDDKEMALECKFIKKNGSVAFKAFIRDKDGILVMVSNYGFTVPSEKSSDFAVFLAQYTYDNMFEGTFDYNVNGGTVVFRITIPYEGSVIGESTIRQRIEYLIETVENTNVMFEKKTKEGF